jgi:cytochrome c-type biogenesis protein CcmH
MMIDFWLLAALLTAAVLALVLFPLLRTPSADPQESPAAMHSRLHSRRLAELEAERDNGNLDAAQFAAAREELERELLHDTAHATQHQAVAGSGRWAAVLVLVAVPLLAVLLYRQLGSVDQVSSLPQAQAPMPTPAEQTAQGQDKLPSVEEMVAGLAARMVQNPEQVEGWLLLGRSHVALQRYDEAVQAYARAFALQPENATVMTRYAEALALANDNILAGRPAELIQQALDLEPQNPDALWLSAMSHAQRGQYPDAIVQLRSLLQSLAADSPDAQMVQNQIAELQEQIDGPLEPVAPAPASAQARTPTEPSPPAAPPAAGPAIRVTVNLAPELRARLAPGDTLFIYARAVSGPRMPLAMARLTAADLPASVSLDDASAMMPAMKLSNFEEVMVMARVSRSGNAMTQSGDLLGSTGPIAVGASPSVEVTIDEQVP